MKWVLVSLTVALMASNAARAEHARGGDADPQVVTDGKDGKTPHPVAGDAVWAKDKMDIVASLRPDLQRSYIDRRYAKAIPEAMQKADSGDPMPLATIVAEILNTDNAGLKATMSTAKAKLDEEKGKEFRRDDKIVSFLEKVLITEPVKLYQDPANPQKTLPKESKDPKDKAFLTAVKEANVKEEKRGDDAIAAAKRGDKETVKKLVSHSAILDWSAKHMNGPHAADVKNVLKAFTHDANDGHSFIDMTAANGQKQRLWLGNNASSFDSSINKFLEAKGGFNATVAAEFHDQPNVQWRVNERGQFVPEAPPGVTAPQRGAAKPGAGPLAEAGKAKERGPDAQKESPGQAKGADPGATYASRCTSCHGRSQPAIRGDNGSQAARVRAETMPPGGGLSPDEKAAILKHLGQGA